MVDGRWYSACINLPIPTNFPLRQPIEESGNSAGWPTSRIPKSPKVRYHTRWTRILDQGEAGYTDSTRARGGCNQTMAGWVSSNQQTRFEAGSAMPDAG